MEVQKWHEVGKERRKKGGPEKGRRMGKKVLKKGNYYCP